MYYELDVVDKPEWINHIIRTTNADNMIVLQIDFVAKYLTHAHGSQQVIGYTQHEIYMFRTSDTLHTESNGRCEIRIKTQHFVDIITEQSKYGLKIILFSDMHEEVPVYIRSE